MKVRDAALLRTEKVEKQKAEVEAARDKLKCVFALTRCRRRGWILHMALTAIDTSLLTTELPFR